MYRLHNCTEIVKKLHVFIFGRSFIENLNSCSFFLTEREELKSSISRVDSENTKMDLQLNWNHLLVMPVEKTVPFRPKIVYKKRFMAKIGNNYPMLILHFAELSVDVSKSVIVNG